MVPQTPDAGRRTLTSKVSSYGLWVAMGAGCVLLDQGCVEQSVWRLASGIQRDSS